MVDVHLNWLNWFHFLILEGDLLVFLDILHDFSVTILKCYKDFYINNIFPLSFLFAEFLWKSTNSSIKSSTFPPYLKLADVTPLHKKGKKDKKGNYRPVSFLPTLSKCFEKWMFSQKSAYFNEIFSKYQ